MNDVAWRADTQDIVISEVLPHAPETLWRALTTGGLIGRWLMTPSGFEPVEGNRFTFQTTPAGQWDGVIHCEVLQVIPNKRLAFAWRGGHESNVGYGSQLDTVVSFDLAPASEGTRLRLVHSGFILSKNETAFRSMSEGWKGVVHKIDEVAGDVGAGAPNESTG